MLYNSCVGSAIIFFYYFSDEHIHKKAKVDTVASQMAEYFDATNVNSFEIFTDIIFKTTYY